MGEAAYQQTFWSLVADVPPAVVSAHIVMLTALVVFEVRLRLMRRRTLRRQARREGILMTVPAALELEPSGVS